jgi:two-component system CheB/CheR fusion protein
MAFVLVQHLDPTHESLAPEILSRTTRMSVQAVEDGMRTIPNHVYVIPANASMGLLRGVLSLLPRTETRGQALVIDSFFQSLAVDQRGRAIGVVLSGTASDGTQGLKAIKAEGGLAIAQDPKSARYDGMPKSAIASGAVDLILRPKEIAQELARISKHPYIAAVCAAAIQDPSDHEGKKEIEAQPNEALRKIFVLLRKETQIDFSNYKQTTLMRRIQRRMMVRKSDSIDAYAKYIHDNPSEAKALFADVLIHVTEFFRDSDSFKALRDHVFPQLIKNRNTDAPIRIWVPGCSSGEEAYSLAILLIEFLSEAGVKIPIQIFATDISEIAIQKARAGVYPESIEHVVSKDRVKLFLDKVGGGYKINKAIRDLCLFSRHDVTSDPPFSKLDLVSCRNVLIYFDSILQKRVIPVFHYALNPGGFLWLGRSESPGHSNLFNLVDKTHKIYSGTNTATPMTYRFPLNTYAPEPEATVQKTPQIVRGRDDFQKDADRITLSKYAPPSVVVNAGMEILQFRGRTVPYLEPASGLPSSHLLKMARPELLPALSQAMQLATKKNAPARQDGLSFESDGKRIHVNIEVVPANPQAAPKERSFVIFFEEASSSPAPVQSKRGLKKAKDKSDGKNPGQRLSQLEQDLSASKQYQQSMTEEFEAAQEELTSANEELQSTNEELQSTNEELQTAKEELQSSNEELNTVNDELQTRNTDLTVLSSDLNNLLNSSEIPIVIVGNDHRIRRFTPKAEKFFKLIPGDVGRPISDLRSDLDLDLDSLVSEVVESLSPQEKEIKDRQGRWMRLQIRPYKTIDNRIDGAVIALVDIEALKQRVKEAKKSQDYLTSVAETVNLPLVILDDQLRLKSGNRAFWEHFKLSSKITDKKFFPSLEISNDDLQSLTDQTQKLFGDTSNTNKAITNFEVDCELPQIGRRTLLLSASRLQWSGELLSQEPQAILLSLEDITERNKAETELANERHKVELIFQKSPGAMALWRGKNLVFEKVNPQYQAIFGDRVLVDKPLMEALPELAGQPFPCLLGKVWDTGEPCVEKEALTRLSRNQDGPIEDQYFDYSFIRVNGPDGKPYGIYCHAIDVTDRVLARRALEESQGLLQTANQTKDVFLATLSHELRTPLTSILSWAQLIQKQKFDPDKLKHAIETIEQSAKTQGQLIDDLLDISRIQSGKLSINFSEVDPCVPVGQSVEAVRLMAESKHVTIETEINAQSITLWADPERLQQIVWNLLTNAIKFSKPSGTVRVRVEPAENNGARCLSIKVIDQGKGIPPEFLDKLFERFSQADSSSTRVHGGLGLGLAIVRDLVQLQGGSVRAESEGLGKGATFTALLPIRSDATEMTGGTRTPAKEKIQEEVESPDLSGLSVMIVEDEPKTREVLVEALNSFGAKTVACTSAAEAFAAFDKFKPDVLVSDIAMPDEDGYSLIRKIRGLAPEQGGDVPSLALTAYATAEDAKRALAAGFHSHMSKPFDAFRVGHEVAKLAHRLTRKPM